MVKKMQQKRKGRAGSKGSLWMSLFILAVMVALVLPLNVQAGNVTSGTLGYNDGIEWTYDADTKTLTVTGEDWLIGAGGSASPFYYAGCSDVEIVIIRDCKISGNASGLFGELRKLVTVEFDNFDTSDIKSMSAMFYECNSLTELDLSGFDTSNVTYMSEMFYNCSSLTDLDLSSFNTSNVTNMESMFEGCSSLTELDLSSFDTSNVTGADYSFGMRHMFYGCSSLKKLDLSNFDTSNVTNMWAMFHDCSSLTELDLSNFDTSNVTEMGYMFWGCRSLKELDLSSFDTAKASCTNSYGNTGMSAMFTYCDSLEKLDIRNFTLAGSVNSKFYDFVNLKSLNMSNCNTSNVTDMGRMFYGCSSLMELDLSGFDTGNVTDMSQMFYGCNGLTELDLSGFDTSNVTDMGHMFRDCSSLTKLDLSSFDTGNVTTMYGMFTGCSSLIELDLSNFNTGNVADVEYQSGMSYMFFGCSSLTELDLSSFDTSNVTDMYAMFYDCSSLTELDLSSFDTGNVTDMGDMFCGCSSLKELDLSSFDTSNVTTMYSMFLACWHLEKLYTPNIMPAEQSIVLPGEFTDSEQNVTSVLTADFCNDILTREIIAVEGISLSDTSLTLTVGDTDFLTATVTPENATIQWVNWSTSDEAVATVGGYGYAYITAKAPGEAIITATTEDNSDIYAICTITVVEKEVARGTLGDNNNILWTYDEDTKTLTMTGEDSGVCSVSNSCESPFVEICSDVERIVVEDCVLHGSAKALFAGLEKLEEIEFNNFDASNVTEMSFMFDGCSSLEKFDLSGFNTSKVTDMDAVFRGCSSLEALDLSGIDTSSVTSMYAMFCECESLAELDLSSFNTSNVTNVCYMFSDCSNLLELDLSSFKLNGEIYTDKMFENCTALEKIHSPAYMDAEISIALPGKFADSEENATSALTADFCNDILTRVAEDVAVERIILSDTNLTLAVEDSYLLTVTVVPENASNKAVFWSTSDESVATVSEGLIQTKAPGEVIIIVTSEDNPDIFTICEVSVVNPFADVPFDQWYYKFVKEAYDKGIMAGTGKTADGLIKFDPEGKVTREQFVQILYNMEGKPAVEYQDIFSDVPEQSGSVWYSNAVMWAVEKGITSGYPNGQFGVGDPITREQVALMLLKYANIKGYDTTQRADVAELRENFSDVDDIDSWALDGMCWAVANGVMKGTAGGKLMPLGNATRAEAATMFLNMLKAYEE